MLDLCIYKILATAMQARNYSTLKDASSLYELILPPQFIAC